MAQQIPAKGEEPRGTKIFNKWKGVVTSSARNTLPDDVWWNLENMQPIGDGNIQTVNNISASLYNFSSDSIYWMQYANLLGVDYLFLFSTGGKIFQYTIGVGTAVQINSAYVFSGSGSRLAQWKNTVILFVDSTGYYSYQGFGTFAPVSGTGVPTSGTDIAVAFGRVWIAQGRLITFSGANDFSAASFTVANGAGSVALTDPTLRSTVTRLISQNGYLYFIGNTCINAISDLYVPSGASPPTPLFTNTNLQAVIGSDQPGSFFPLNRGLMFANRYGAWVLNGVQAERVSEDIDGTWKYINQNLQISGGCAVSNNIISSGFLVQRANDPDFGSNTVVAMLSDKKWWFANYGAITFLAQAIANNMPQLYGLIGNQLYLLFADPTTGPNTVLSTPLWGMEDSLADKEVIRAGFEVTGSVYNGSFTMTVDGVNNQFVTVALTGGGVVAWVNNSGATVQWQNNTPAIVTWFSGAYLLYNGAGPGTYSKYVGLTIKSSGSIYQFSAADMDYKLRSRWN